MKRRLVALAGVSLATAALLAPAAPAAASDGDVCVGSGTAKLSAGIYAGIIKTNVDFTITINGICVPSASASVTASGRLFTASCGASTGQGTARGHSFNITTAGSLVVIDGGVNGSFQATPQPAVACSAQLGGSGASEFTVTGSATFA